MKSPTFGALIDLSDWLLLTGINPLLYLTKVAPQNAEMAQGQ